MKAAIDIGTNSLKLLIGEFLPEGKFHRVFQTLRFTRLGERIPGDGVISPRAMERTLAALEELKKLAQEFGADKIGAFATEGVRKASNRAFFIREARLILGGPLTVLTSTQEGKLSRNGALLNQCLPSDKTLVIDIGGGSTEITGPNWARSTPLGHVLITEEFLKTDPPSMKEIEAARKYIAEILSGIDLPGIPDEASFIGVGGTVVSLAALSHLGEEDPPDSNHGEYLTVEKIESIVIRLLGLNSEIRIMETGLPPRRADVLPAGGLILTGVMKKLDTDSICVSELGLLAGALAGAGNLDNAFWSLQ